MESFTKIVGRSKDLIIRGGENIYPKEVEDIFIEHKGFLLKIDFSEDIKSLSLDVIDCHVVGVSSIRMGEECAAYVRLKSGANIEEVRSYVKDKLAYFKVPKFIEIIDEYPMTVTGKIQKFELRKAAEIKFGEN